MSTVSLCMIVKNEAEVLERSLKDIYKIADEIIITDTGSTDKTVEIAKKYTDKIYHFDWINDFSSARNFTDKYAVGDYILRWDADFILRNPVRNFNTLRHLKTINFKNKDIVSFTWNIDFDQNGNPDKQISNFFFYKNNKFHWESPIHNSLVSNNPKETITELFEQTIEVDHIKDPIKKRYRYKQTAQIIKEVLKKDPNNIKLLINEAENFIFLEKPSLAATNLKKVLEIINETDARLPLIVEMLTVVLLQIGEFDQALHLTQKYLAVKNDPRIQLSYADVIAVITPKKAVAEYQKYLSTPYKKDLKSGPFNSSRYIHHPQKMISLISTR